MMSHTILLCQRSYKKHILGKRGFLLASNSSRNMKLIFDIWFINTGRCSLKLSIRRHGLFSLWESFFYKNDPSNVNFFAPFRNQILSKTAKKKYFKILMFYQIYFFSLWESFLYKNCFSVCLFYYASQICLIFSFSFSSFYHTTPKK